MENMKKHILRIFSAVGLFLCALPQIAVAQVYGTQSSGIGPLAFTPTDTSGAALIFTGVNAFYTLYNHTVCIAVALTYPTTASGSASSVGNLPFVFNTSASNQQLVGLATGQISPIFVGVTNTPTIQPASSALAPLTNVSLSGSTVRFSGCYLTN